MPSPLRTGLSAYPAAMAFDNLPADGQPQSAAAGFPATGGIDVLEPVEQPWQGIRRHAGSRIVKGRRQFAVFDLTAQYGQRRTQLVKDIGKSLPAHLLISIRRAGQDIEVRGQLIEFIIACGSHPDAEIPIGQSPGSPDEVPDGTSRYLEKRKAIRAITAAPSR